MCTLALAWQVFDEAPVAVAANRDEAVDRPSSPPSRRGSRRAVVAPRDEVAGGTWIGVNDAGVFAGLTNRWAEVPLEGARSRGLLVEDALACDSAVAGASCLERPIEEAAYAGFYLVIADAADAFVLEWDGELSVTRLDSGVHVVVNVGFDEAFRTVSSRQTAATRQAASARRIRGTLESPAAVSASAWLERAGDVLGDHEYGVCVHEDGFGTRSSSLISVGESLSYAFADGPPCRTEYEPVAVDGLLSVRGDGCGRESQS